MKILLWLFIAPVLLAGPLNEKYSYKAFHTNGVTFKGVDVSEFNDTDIIGTQFFQEWQEGEVDVTKDIFPDGMTGVTFIKCNLDNILIPVGNTVQESTAKKLKVQNDLNDWIVDDKDKPLEPKNKDDYILAGHSIDPKDIPAEKITEDEFKIKQDEIKEAKK
jgi:phage-related protein